MEGMCGLSAYCYEKTELQLKPLDELRDSLHELCREVNVLEGWYESLERRNGIETWHQQEVGKWPAGLVCG